MGPAGSYNSSYGSVTPLEAYALDTKMDAGYHSRVSSRRCKTTTAGWVPFDGRRRLHASWQPRYKRERHCC